ncbi:MAG: CBS domain-containing protein [Myxococcota bacterium]
MTGLVTSDGLRVLANEGSDLPWAIAADLMQPPVSVQPHDDLRVAIERIVHHGLREVPVVDGRGAVVGFLDEADVAAIYLKTTSRPPSPPDSSPGRGAEPAGARSAGVRRAD